jgi:ABC-type spermidine/putrescine transport system permease subunit II
MSTAPSLPESPEQARLDQARQNRIIAIGVLVLLVLLAGVVAAVVFMARNPAATETIRDIFIIVMALESLVIGSALIVLIVQIAQLTNLLRHEIKPILDSTNETVSTVRGTTAFLSENLVEPVIKLNAYVAGLQQVLEGLRLFWPRR